MLRDLIAATIILPEKLFPSPAAAISPPPSAPM
jgi:hypothetical protein